MTSQSRGLVLAEKLRKDLDQIRRNALEARRHKDLDEPLTAIIEDLNHAIELLSRIEAWL